MYATHGVVPSTLGAVVGTSDVQILWTVWLCEAKCQYLRRPAHNQLTSVQVLEVLVLQHFQKGEHENTAP